MVATMGQTTTSPFGTFDAMSLAPVFDHLPPLTISPAQTSLQFSGMTPEIKIDPPKTEEKKPEEKKPVKKRRSWGQELPIPKTNLPPRKRAKTEDEKEQRRIERVLRNRAAAQTSRERKRLEVEKLENEKKAFEAQNAILRIQLAQMEAENNRLNQELAKLSAEVRGSRGASPHTACSSDSPTLAPVLFKQEQDDMSLEKISFPRTPSLTPSPSPAGTDATDSKETSDLAQHPAAVLCDLQCQSEDSKDQEVSLSLPSLAMTRPQGFTLTLQIIIQHLFLMMTSAAYSTVILPMSQIFHSLKQGSPLTFSPEEIGQHLPLILWLLSTPTLSASRTSSPRPVFRIRLLARLLECSPALARPLRDATSRALQLALREMTASGPTVPTTGVPTRDRQDWRLLMTMIWAIDRITKNPAITTSTYRQRLVPPSESRSSRHRYIHNFRAGTVISKRMGSSGSKRMDL